MAAWKQPLDPAEKLDFEMRFDLGARPLLETGETIEEFDVAPDLVAAEAGLRIAPDAPEPALTEDKRGIVLWLDVDPAKRAAAGWKGRGKRLAVVASITTSSERVRSRSFLVRVRKL